MSIFYRIYKKLFPRRSIAWRISPDSMISKVLNGITSVWDDVRTYIDLRLLDAFMDQTTALDKWEEVFGFLKEGLTDDERRDRLTEARFKLGEPTRANIEAQLQLAGFEVYVYEFWDSLDPVVIRDAAYWLSTDVRTTSVCGSTTMVCGGATALCGASLAGAGGYPLVNRYRDTLNTYVEYAVTTDPATFPYYVYIGGSTFGSFAPIPVERKLEFETLVLKLMPSHLWVGILIDFYTTAFTRVSVDASGTEHVSISTDSAGTDHTLIGTE